MVKEPSMFNVLYTIGPTKSGAHGVAAIKKAFKVDDKKAKELLDKAIDFSSSGKIKTLTRSQQSMLNKQSDSMKEEVISEKNFDYAALAKVLNADEKAVLQGRAKGLTFAQISDETGISRTKVRNVVYKALKKLSGKTGIALNDISGNLKGSMKEEVISELTIKPFKKGQKVKVFLAKSRDRELKDLAPKFGDTIVGTIIGQTGNYYMVKTPKGQLNPHKDDVLGEAKVRTIVDPKKSDAYSKHMKSNKLDDDTVRFLHQNPDYAHSKRFMKDPKYAKAVSLYKAAMGEAKEMKDLDTKNVDKALAHDCAKHVVHEKWGEGKCIPEMHSLEEGEDGTGFVTHYDVMFEHGVEQNVPVWDLEIVVSENHMHSKKKMKEEVELDENYRQLALKGIGAETPNTITVGRGVDYYSPKDGSKHMGKITKVGKTDYEVKDDKTGKTYKFKYWTKQAAAALKEEVEQIEEIHAPGTRVKVPHKGKTVSGKVVRYDKGDRHGSPYYVVDVGEYESPKISAHRVQKEEVELDEAGPKIDPAKMAAHMARNDKPKKMSSTQKSLAAIRQKVEEFDNGDEVEGGNEEPQMDPVNKKALKKKFKDRKDKDIDNDGDVDDSDKYLHMRRKAVSKALDKKNN